MSVKTKPTTRPVSRPQDTPSSKSEDKPIRTDTETFRIRDWASI